MSLDRLPQLRCRVREPHYTLAVTRCRACRRWRSDQLSQGATRLPHAPGRPLSAVVDAIAHIDVETPWLAKQGFVAGAAAPMPVAGGLGLAIRVRFHNRAPEQLAIGLAFHQQAANQLGGNLLGGASKEGLGEGREGFYG